jgi:hypothetical protein
MLQNGISKSYSKGIYQIYELVVQVERDYFIETYFLSQLFAIINVYHNTNKN